LTGVARANSPDPEALASTLKRMANERASLDVAQFRFIGLDKIQAAYGEDWPVYRDQVRAAAHEHIVRRLGPDDLLVRGGDGFLVIYGSLSGREAELETLSLTHGLNDFFLARSAEGAPMPQVDAQSSAVPVQSLAGMLNRADVRSPPEDAINHAPRLADIEWRFQPEWDVRGEAIVGYTGVTVHCQTGERLAGYLFDPPPGRLPSLAAIDAATLQVSEEAARSLFASGKRARITTPIHITSLSNGAARAQLLSAFEMIDHDLARFRVIRIAGVTPGFPRMYLDEAINHVRRAVPNIALATAWNEPDVGALLQANVATVGFSLPPAATLPSLQPSVLAKVRTAVGAAHGLRKPFFVEGAITSDLAMRLSAMGVDLLSSPDIWPPVAKPEGVLKWTADRLSRR
jgi:hypothetical protein